MLKAQGYYLSGKLGFYENAYAQSIRDHQAAVDILTAAHWDEHSCEGDKAKIRIAKAYMNMALTKSMSSNHKAAHVICDQALPHIEAMSATSAASLPEEDTGGQAKARHAKIVFKYWFKKAILYKRATSFRQSYETLESLSLRVTERERQIEKGTDEYRDARSYLYKAHREMARVCSLLKRFAQETRHEQQSWDLFCELYGEVPGWHPKEQSFDLTFLPVTVKEIEENTVEQVE